MAWSTPILSSEGRALGTFAIYYREPRHRTPYEDNIIERVTHLASIAIEREQAEEAQLRLGAIVASSDDAIISKTLGGIMTSWNAGAQRIFGYTVEEAVGSPITILIPPDRQDEESLIIDRVRRGDSVDHFETGTPPVRSLARPRSPATSPNGRAPKRRCGSRRRSSRTSAGWM
jgi:PAS domain-containing protein